MNPENPSTATQLSRRALIAGAGKAGLGLVFARLLENATFAQSAVKGKEKLIVRSLRPEDLETPVGLLNTWITPNELFYTRHHAYIPEINLSEFKLTVDGEVAKTLSLTLDDLKKLPRASVTVTLECAGNGRAFFDPPVAGIQWEKGAVGTARFAGARLADVLKMAGVKPTGKYVAMNGADKGVGKQPDFIRNLPMDKAIHPDTILAYEMNGQPIPQIHGAPLRAIAPGWEGAYSVKWLNHLQVIDKEHEGFFVKTAYRYPNRRVAPGAPVDAKDMIPLTGLVVKSFINAPLEGESIKPGRVKISGFAWAGESMISKVDVSMDNGATWVPARLGKEREPYAWQSFTYEFSITRPGSYLLMARATDDKGRIQPVAPQWNPSGYLWNVIDKVRINVA